MVAASSITVLNLKVSSIVMVTEDDGLYKCDVCGLHYNERGTAEECEEFCREHNACNPDLIAQAVENKA